MTPQLATNLLMGLPPEQAIAAAAEYLRARGYAVTAPDRLGDERTVGELCARFGIGYGTMHQRLHHPECPPSFRRLGEKGRILGVVLTPALAVFLSTPKQPGRRLAAPRLQEASA